MVREPDAPAAQAHRLHSPALMQTVKRIEQAILVNLDASMEDCRVPDAIAAHADQRAGKAVTKTDAAQLTVQLCVAVRIRRAYGTTTITWGSYREEKSILLAHSESGVKWPTGQELREKNAAYFSARDERNAKRRTLLVDHDEAVTHVSYIAAAADAIARLRKAKADLEALIGYDAPLGVLRYEVEKIAEAE